MPEAYTGLGGRGLTSLMINKEVPATCDSLGPENKLIMAPGYLRGTVLVNSSRLSIGAKNPLTGGIKESDVGGLIHRLAIPRKKVDIISLDGSLDKESRTLQPGSFVSIYQPIFGG